MRFSLILSWVLSVGLGCTSRSNLVLVTIDTLRRDALGVYAPRVTWTPGLDSLARAGTLWLGARTPFSLTQPSHAAIMTGLYPAQTGVQSNDAVLSESAECLAEELSEKGYACAAFVNTWVLEKPSGLSQGFQVYRPLHHERVTQPVVKEPGASSFSRLNPRAGRTIGTAKTWIDRGTRPFFLWIHLMDPHLDYEPPPIEMALLGIDTTSLEMGRESWWKARRTSGQPVTDSQREVVRALYDAEVASVDRALRELFAHLRQRELHRSTVVAVVSDHGESIMDDGAYLGHARSLHETVIEIPLIMAGPGIPPGSRIGTPVELVQLRATLLRLARGGRRPGRHDLFAREGRVPVTGDASGRLSASWGGWRFVWDRTGDAPAIVERGHGDSAKAHAMADSAVRAHRTFSGRASSRGLNGRDRAALKALGYAE